MLQLLFKSRFHLDIQGYLQFQNSTLAVQRFFFKQRYMYRSLPSFTLSGIFYVVEYGVIKNNTCTNHCIYCLTNIFQNINYFQFFPLSLLCKTPHILPVFHLDIHELMILDALFLLRTSMPTFKNANFKPDFIYAKCQNSDRIALDRCLPV